MFSKITSFLFYCFIHWMIMGDDLLKVAMGEETEGVGH